MTDTMRVSWFILRTSITERLTYRGDFAFATLIRFLPILTQIFLWGAVYAVGTSTPRESIQGYKHGDIIAYYLLANLARAFSSMPGLAGSIARDVRDGGIKRYLTQPVDLLGYVFWARVAHKLVYYVVAAIPFAIVFFLCRSYFRQTPDLVTVLAFIFSLLLAFLLGFLLEALIGLSSFWFLEINSLVFVFMMLNYFLSGHMIPLDFLTSEMPAWVGAGMELLPFKFLAYTPSNIMLGRYHGNPAALATQLVIGTGWVVALFLLCRVMYSRGVRRYSAFGG